MKKNTANIIRKLLALAVTLAVSATGVCAAEYPDMPTGWSAPAMRAAVDAGILRGDDNGRLNPGGTLSRAELATILVRVLGRGEKGDLNNFSDLEPGQWFYEDMQYAVGMGLMKGFSGSVMEPRSPVSRNQLFVVIARVLGLRDGNPDAMSRFRDRDAVPDWAAGSIAAMAGAGYIQGDDLGFLKPDADISREQFAQVLYNIVGAYRTGADPLTGDINGSMVVSIPGTDLENLTIHGDLIVGDGVGEGGLNLRKVTITGRLVIRGGGPGAVVLTDCAVAEGVEYISHPDAVVETRSDDSKGSAGTGTSRPGSGHSSHNKPDRQDEYDLATAWQKLPEARNCRITHRIVKNDEINRDNIFEKDGNTLHEYVNYPGWEIKDEYYAVLTDSGERSEGMKHFLKSWIMLDEDALGDIELPPSLPDSIDVSHYERIGEGLYQATEEFRDTEGRYLVTVPGRRNVVDDVRIQVQDGNVASVIVEHSYNSDYSSIKTEESLTFEDYGQIDLTYPEEFICFFDAGSLYERAGNGETVSGETVYVEGPVYASMDECVIVEDQSGTLIPVYYEGEMPDEEPIGIMAIAGTDGTRFRGLPALTVNDPEQVEWYEPWNKDDISSGNDLEDMDGSPCAVVDFTCLQVPSIPDEEALADEDYLVTVTDCFGTEAQLYLGDAGAATQDPQGSAAKFREQLRTSVAGHLDSTGDSSCAMDFSSILLLGGRVFAPVIETEFRLSDGPGLTFVPASRRIFVNEDTDLETLLSGVSLVSAADRSQIPVSDLEFRPEDFDPGKAGDYTVSVVYKGMTLEYPIQVLDSVADGFYQEHVDGTSLGELSRDQYASASLPSKGDVHFLVIPVRFTDSPGFGTDLETAFNNSTDGSTGWYSLKEYYQEVSFGQLNLTADILPPFETGMAAADLDSVYYSAALQKIVEMAMTCYDDRVDFSEYDQNDDGKIDCVYFVYDYPMAEESSLWWAFVELMESGTYDGKALFQYLWCSEESFLLDFLSLKGQDDNDDGVPLNCRILIHETGHALGLEDYYGYYHNGAGDTMMMCSDLGDHDPLSKMFLDWIHPAFDYAEPQKVTLRSCTDTGDVLILSPDEEISYFKEFFTISLYTPTGVNKAFSDKNLGLFTKPGVMIYRMNSELNEMSIYPNNYTKYNNNRRSIEDSLIRLIQNHERTTLEKYPNVAEDADLFLEGDSYLFTWPDEESVCMTMTVDRIYQDESGTWCADITLK